MFRVRCTVRLVPEVELLQLDFWYGAGAALALAGVAGIAIRDRIKAKVEAGFFCDGARLSEKEEVSRQLSNLTNFP